MKLSTINESISIIANIGVIASIVFLRLEMRQNTSMIKSQTRDAMTEKQMQFYEGLIENEDIAEFWQKARNAPNTLEDNPTDRWRWQFYWLTQPRMWENEWYQYQQGLFDEGEFISRLDLWERVVSIPIYKEYWESVSYSFSPSFRVALDEIVLQKRS